MATSSPPTQTGNKDDVRAKRHVCQNGCFIGPLTTFLAETLGFPACTRSRGTGEKTDALWIATCCRARRMRVEHFRPQ